MLGRKLPSALRKENRQALHRAACIQTKYGKHYVLIVAMGYPMLEEGPIDERRSELLLSSWRT
jgi:hypothetical protein